MPTVRQRLHSLIFEHDTPAERVFDVVSIAAILVSVMVVMLDSVESIARRHGTALMAAEWALTGVFTVEYVLRVYAAPARWRYVRSFYGIVDLLALLPTYLSILFPPGRFLIVFRLLRVLRIFRILKLSHYMQEASVLGTALRASRQKITVFVATVVTVVVIVGAMMYMIEGEDSGFSNIPEGVYWAIVTLTTVGYGDIAPQTVLGRLLASVLMILGYGIIAVPTGIVTLELDRASRGPREAAAARAQRRCAACGLAEHDGDAAHFKRCGALLAS